MKKTFTSFLIFITLFTFSGCVKKETEDYNLKIVTTIFPYYSFAKEICGDYADISMLIKPGAESHTYDPTAQDILRIKNSDIFIYTGGKSDIWVETILSSIDTSKTKIIKAIDLVDYSEDEHIWTSIKNAIKITESIYGSIDNEQYSNNKDTFVNKLELLDKKFEKAITSSQKTVIFADRFPFSYLANDYGLKYISAFPSCSEESEPSVPTIAKIINTIKEEKISYVFYIEFSNQKIADTISNETSVDKLLFHSCHNITIDDFNSDVSYLSLMNQNLKNLKEAIK